MSALPLSFLKNPKGGLKRFPFLDRGSGKNVEEEIGRALTLTLQSAQKKNKKRELEERKRLEEERKEKEREKREKQRRKRRREKRR